jgi:short-subunit dehydrogenase
MGEGTITRPTALITGASSGIGAELARLFAGDAYDLVLVARRPQPLEELGAYLRRRHGVTVRVFARDLSERGAVGDLWNELTADGVQVDVLVNNAGVGLYGPVWEEDADALDRMVRLNVAVVTSLTRLALPGMVERGNGKILNLASVVGYQPAGPGMTAYYATKAYVLSFSKGLARELRGSGVSVTALSPGVTTTSFEERSGASGTMLYRWVPPMSAKAVALAGYRGMMRKKTVVIPGVIAKLFSFAGELPPRRIALEVNRWLLKRAGSHGSATS